MEFVVDKCKSFVNFLESCGFQRRRLWSTSAEVEILLRPSRAGGGKKAFERWYMVWEPTRKEGFPVESVN